MSKNRKERKTYCKIKMHELYNYTSNITAKWKYSTQDHKVNKFWYRKPLYYYYIYHNSEQKLCGKRKKKVFEDHKECFILIKITVHYIIGNLIMR